MLYDREKLGLTKEGLRRDALLFGESQSRIIISISPRNRKEVEKIIRKYSVPFMLLGNVGGKRLVISVGNKRIINIGLNKLSNAWRGTLPRFLGKK